MSSASSIIKPSAKLSVGEYLALERTRTERHEYYDGRIIAMAGERLPHGVLSSNLVMLVAQQILDHPCLVFSKDTKVRSGLGIRDTASTAGLFSYPDLLVVCGPIQYFDEINDVIVNPTAIIEVLSPSTEAFDRGEKFHRYQTYNPTLQDYLLVSQDRPAIEHYHREADGKWSYQLHSGLEAVVSIPCIHSVLPLANVYRKVPLNDETCQLQS